MSLRTVILQHVPFEGPGSIDDWLAARQATVKTVRLYAGDALPEPADVDLVIAMGGPMSVNDTWFHDWIPAERAFLADCIKQEKAVLGICLGAQLIAAALGARVAPNKDTEIGWFDIQAVTAPEGNFRFPPKATVFHWHGETFELPPGTHLLARSEACENQAFQLGSRVIGLQFHLETTPDSLEDLLEACGEEIEPDRWVQDENTIRARLDDAAAANNQLMSAVLDHLAASLK